MISEVAKRYAVALFESIADAAAYPKTLDELRAVENMIEANKDIQDFVKNPLVQPSEKAQVLAKTLEQSPLSEGVKGLLILLANRNRLSDWSSIMQAFQNKADEANGIVRGVVRSSMALSPEQRNKIETRVTQVTGKKVILEYKVDEALLGGLVAEVGSLTFDDSLETQIKMINDELKRSAH